MKNGIPMREIDGMEILRYLDVLEYEIVHVRKRKDAKAGEGGGEYVRGTIDQLWM